MSWPLSQDYNEAIQAPQSSLDDPELRGGEATTNALGMPMPRSGNFADVYEFKCPATKSKWALKCFTRHVAGQRERYTEISRTLQETRLPFAVEFQYLVKGVRVRGDWFPILKMRWVEGQLLNEIVRDNLDKPAVLNQLVQIWARMGKRLRETGIAHADLQHGNVLFVPGSQKSSLAVKLIDYDGMFVPALNGKKSGEVGHPNFQHPQRLREATYSAEVDRFPLLVVATALQALSVGGRSLWERYDNGDNLLFKESDLRAPAESALFRELLGITEPKTRTFVGALLRASHGKLEETPLIEELMPELKRMKDGPAAATTPPPATNKNAWWGSPPSISPAATGVKDDAKGKSAVGKTNVLDFEESATGSPRRRSSSHGMPKWAWLASGAAVLAFASIAVFAMRGGPKSKATDNPTVASKNSGNRDNPKDVETVQPKDTLTDPTPPPKKDPEKRTALLPRLVASPTLVLLPRGTSELQVKVDRQGYAGPINLRIQNLPPGIMCQRNTVIPADESLVRFEFQTDGTAAEGSPTIEVIALADARTVDRMNYKLLVPKTESVPIPPRVPNERNINSIGIQFVRLPKGTFYMGGGGGKAGAKTEIKEDFEIATHTVTQGQWKTVMGSNPSHFSRRSQRLASGGGDKTLKVWDAVSGQELLTLKGHTGLVFSVCFSPDGKRLASGSEDQTVKVWDAATGQELLTLKGHSTNVLSVCFSPDGKRLASGSLDQTVKVWDVVTGQELLTLKGRRSNIFSVCFSPDGKRLLTSHGSARTAKVWDAATGQELLTLNGHSAGVFSACFSPDGKRMASGSGDKTVRVWDSATGQELLTLKGHIQGVHSVCFSPDGKRLASDSSDQTVKVWDAVSGQELLTLKGHSAGVFSVCFSPDGKRMASASDDKTVKVWDAATGQELLTLNSPQIVRSVCFSPVGQVPDELKDISDADLNQFPVENVSWNDAQEFIKKLNEKERGSGWVNRLPTEAEWEYACRGGATTEEGCSYHFYFDKPTNDLSSKQANFDGTYPAGNALKGEYLRRPTMVNDPAYPPNQLGLHHMHGNVWQWCSDLNFYEKGSTDRVCRGGSLDYRGNECAAAWRRTLPATLRDNSLGFRLVRVPSQSDKPNDPPKVDPAPTTKEIVNTLGMKFVHLPKGTFYMGGGGGTVGTKTEIKEDFEIAIHAVTQGQWQAIMNNNPSEFSRNGQFKDRVKEISDDDLKQFPVESVTWNDAQVFINKLNDAERGKGWVYRLPASAEWEYACRGGATSEEECSYHFYFDNPTNDLSSEQANFNGNSPFGQAPKGKYLERPTKVGSYKPNRLGLFDMQGNVWQWCADLYANRGPDRVNRVNRGGSWGNGSSDCRAANRGRSAPAYRNPFLGFRLARVSTGASSDNREVWRYTTDGKVGYFTHTTGKQWVETAPPNIRLVFNEVERREQYVELYDSGRKMGLRLYPDHGEIRQGNQNWNRWYPGGWISLRDVPESIRK